MAKTVTGPKQDTTAKQLVDAANLVCEASDADLVLMFGGLWESLDYMLDASIQTKRKRPNVCLVIATYGGSPDVAYKISRMLQKRYNKFTAIVDAFCKSAGTLTAIGAHELVMSDRGELGPLDIQVARPDEPKEHTSGLAPVQALKILQEQATESYAGMFETLSERLSIPTRTAITTADHLTSALFSRIYQQLEPIRLGEYQRAMTIMTEYGKRLCQGSKNLKDGSLDKLITEYPDHGFAIDRHEAEELFFKVRTPSPAERGLLALLDALMANKIGITKKPAFLEYYAAENPGGSESDDQQPPQDGEQVAVPKSGRAPGRSPKKEQANGVPKEAAQAS